MNRIRHIVMWSFESSVSDEERNVIAKKFKEEMEQLENEIEGVLHVHVQTQPLDSSNRHLLLDSSFVDEKALMAYQTHQKHKEAASLIKGKVRDRGCFDYQE